jgi:hypothetical protein
MCGRIRRKGEVMFLRPISEIVEDSAGLDDGDAPVRIEFKDVVHILGKIDDHGNVATLSGETRASAAGQKGCSFFATYSNCLHYIFYIVGDDDTDRDLAIVGAIRRIQRATSIIEPHLSPDAHG